jgi:hypothetical protein
MLRWAFGMGILCISLAAAPSVIESLDEKGLLDRAGLGALAGWREMLGGGGDERVTLPTEFDATRGLAEAHALEQPKRKPANARLITPRGEMTDEELRSLVAEAERLAPIALTRARMKRALEPPGTPQEEFTRAMAEAQQREAETPPDPGTEPEPDNETPTAPPPSAPAPQ